MGKERYDIVMRKAVLTVGVVGESRINGVAMLLEQTPKLRHWYNPRMDRLCHKRFELPRPRIARMLWSPLAPVPFRSSIHTLAESSLVSNEFLLFTPIPAFNRFSGSDGVRSKLGYPTVSDTEAAPAISESCRKVCIVLVHCRHHAVM